MKADVPRAVSARVFARNTPLEYGVFQLQQVVKVCPVKIITRFMQSEHKQLVSLKKGSLIRQL